MERKKQEDKIIQGSKGQAKPELERILILILSKRDGALRIDFNPDCGASVYEILGILDAYCHQLRYNLIHDDEED